MESTTSQSAIDRDSLAEVTLSVTEAAQDLFSGGRVTDTLASVVELAVATIEGCDFAGISLIDGDTVANTVHTDPMVLEVDALQHRKHQGPSFDAMFHRLILYADDLDNDLR